MRNCSTKPLSRQTKEPFKRNKKSCSRFSSLFIVFFFVNIILPRDEKKANVRDVIYGPAALLNPDCHLKRSPWCFDAPHGVRFPLKGKSEFLFIKFARRELLLIWRMSWKCDFNQFVS